MSRKKYIREKTPKASLVKNGRNTCAVVVLVGKQTHDEILALATSRGITRAAFLRELIEIGLMELEDQGEICR